MASSFLSSRYGRTSTIPVHGNTPPAGLVEVALASLDERPLQGQPSASSLLENMGLVVADIDDDYVQPNSKLVLYDGTHAMSACASRDVLDRIHIDARPLHGRRVFVKGTACRFPHQDSNTTESQNEERTVTLELTRIKVIPGPAIMPIPPEELIDVRYHSSVRHLLVGTQTLNDVAPLSDGGSTVSISSNDILAHKHDIWRAAMEETSLPRHKQHKARTLKRQRRNLYTAIGKRDQDCNSQDSTSDKDEDYVPEETQGPVTVEKRQEADAPSQIRRRQKRVRTVKESTTESEDRITEDPNNAGEKKVASTTTVDGPATRSKAAEKDDEKRNKAAVSEEIIAEGGTSNDTTQAIEQPKAASPSLAITNSHRSLINYVPKTRAARGRSPAGGRPKTARKSVGRPPQEPRKKPPPTIRKYHRKKKEGEEEKESKGRGRRRRGNEKRRDAASKPQTAVISTGASAETPDTIESMTAQNTSTSTTPRRFSERISKQQGQSQKERKADENSQVSSSQRHAEKQSAKNRPGPSEKKKSNETYVLSEQQPEQHQQPTLSRPPIKTKIIVPRTTNQPTDDVISGRNSMRGSSSAKNKRNMLLDYDRHAHKKKTKDVAQSSRPNRVTQSLCTSQAARKTAVEEETINAAREQSLESGEIAEDRTFDLKQRDPSNAVVPTGEDAARAARPNEKEQVARQGGSASAVTVAPPPPKHQGGEGKQAAAGEAGSSAPVKGAAANIGAAAFKADQKMVADSQKAKMKKKKRGTRQLK